MASDTAAPAINWMLCSKSTELVIPPNATASGGVPDDDTLWLFLDESGNFDFSPTGTKYFIMTCLATRRPFGTCHDLMDAKYDFFEKGVTMKKFHATEDNREVRMAVYDIISRHGERLSAYSIYVNKRELPVDLMDAGKLYGKVFEWITGEALTQEVTPSTDKVIVVTDDIPKEAKKKQVIKPLKKLLKDFSEKTGVSAYLEHFPSESDFNLQIADYLCWAFMRREAAGQEWPYSKVASVFSETGCLVT